LSRSRTKRAPFPSRQQILQYIQDSQRRVGKRDIARAFKLDSEQKRMLKTVLREMQDEGVLERGRGRRVHAAGMLPKVTVVEITGTDMDGEVLARPVTWEGDREPPLIYMAPSGRQPAPGRGDRLLAKLKLADDGTYEGHAIRRIAEAPTQILGVYRLIGGQGRLLPTDRRSKGEFLIEQRDARGAKPGDLVRAEPLTGRRLGLRQARVVERLHGGEGPAAPSMIAIADYDLPTAFAPEAEREAGVAGPAPLAGRDDLRSLALVTIDGADARDFDDAVWAEPDCGAGNPGGWHLVVAIADVAWYVRPGGALDRDAYQRGNSVYFPDRVVPMLPEPLSNGWCSLKPGEDRPCVVADLTIDENGRLLRHRFRRALMRSAARLTYDQVQRAADGRPDDTTGALMETAIGPLYGAYRALKRHRHERGVLELDLPERQVLLDVAGGVAGIAVRDRFDSHKLIEEFMIAANVAAAETLEKQRMPCLYRIHDEPSAEKLRALAEVLDGVGIRFAKGQVVTPARFNQVLKKAAGTPHAEMINEIVLRTQAQAEYAPDNIGHFGLALRRYCHFTSPIRRYSDLVVHRALIDGCGLGEGGLGRGQLDLAAVGEHVSMTERRAADAERDAVDRFTALFLADRVGAVFAGRINGVTRFGLFVTLNETGADGLVPVSTLGGDRFVHDETRHVLRGQRTRQVFRLGDPVEVMLMEANPVTGGMIFRLVDEAATGHGPAQGRGRRPTGKGRQHRRR